MSVGVGGGGAGGGGGERGGRHTADDEENAGFLRDGVLERHANARVERQASRLAERAECIVRK